MPRNVGRAALTALLPVALGHGRIAAQEPTHPTIPGERRTSARERVLWATAAVGFVAAVALDDQLRSVALANRSPSLDRLASGADVIGTARHIVPALIGTYVVERLTGHRGAATVTLRVGLSYAAADLLEATLKPTVGRGRPSALHPPLTFRPLTSNGEFHSFPSAHVVHVAALGTAIAVEADRPWITALTAVAITYVGAERVYRDQHWTSDAVASAILGAAVAYKTTCWLRARHRLQGR